MAASSIEYIELYTIDKEAAVDYFVSSLGFRQVAESVEVDRNSALLRQGEVDVVVTTGPATRDFLEEHGDGVADIALTCDDVAATRAAAVAAGARASDSGRGNPVLSGFGGCSHTLLPLAESAGKRPPAGRTWLPTQAAPVHPAGRIRLLDHVAICLDGGTLVDYADFYGAAFGLARYSSEYITVGDQAMDSIVVRSPSGAVTFTLLEPDSFRADRRVPGEEWRSRCAASRVSGRRHNSRGRRVHGPGRGRPAHSWRLLRHARGALSRNG